MISRLPTIAKAVEQIRAGDLTAAELVEFCLERIERHEPAIEAWESVDHAGARREAAVRDEQARAGKRLGPLHGIPVGVKDIVDVAGWPTRAGSPTRADHVATADAELVRLLRQAGAIILGKTVTTEFASFDPSRTRNPWNRDRTPGGSSSGSAAAVAMEMCMAAIGTQTGGSIIRPAAFCGVCGLKPTKGQISLRGVVPVSEHLDHAGPIARTVQDAARVFFALATPGARAAMKSGTQSGPLCRGELEPRESEANDALEPFDQWIMAAPTDTAAVKLLRLDGYSCFAEHAAGDVRACYEAALEQLPGATSPAPLPAPASLARVLDRHRRVMAVDAAAVHRDVFETRAGDFGPQISSLIEAGMRERAVDYVEAVRGRPQLRDEMTELLGNDTLAVMPATPTTAPTRETTGDPRFNSPWSYAGVPAITIPCGLAANGLPCGLQIIGPAHSEPRLLRAAWLCEQALGFDESPPDLL